MARSLTVKHEETTGTSPLLNAFLLIALAWLIGAAFTANASENTATPLVVGQ